jgi:hypothetical protein
MILSRKVVIIFFEISPAILSIGGDFSLTVKPDYEKSLEPLSTFTLKDGVMMGKIF